VLSTSLEVERPSDGLVQTGTAEKLSGGHFVREVNLFPSTCVTHNESDAWRWGNWSSVLWVPACLSKAPSPNLHKPDCSYLIAKTTHTGTDGLLFDLQTGAG